ncbi:hypothetical protein L6164_003525 [Bauhinia variegata]|uniref:Uncharacterized protein n=1 Tax=Bauhinia variegata TaxID=167791 RepID=A0ACB9Q1R7_BAUVA|nr:hypothetical protein L6164_003525 [Bauhinia variegata]
MLLDNPFRSAIIILAILILHYKSCCAKSNHDCATLSCGHIHNISYPFRLKQDPKHCGDFRYELSCENNFTFLYLYSGKYYVKALNYNNYTIRVVDAAIEREIFSSRPSFSLARFNFSRGDSFSWFKYKWKEPEIYPQLSKPISFLNCAEPVNSPVYVDTAACNTCMSNTFDCYIDDMDQIHCLHHGPASTIHRMISVVKGILWTVFFYLMIHLSAKSLCGTPVVILFLPANRPDMSRVMNMLESEVESLAMPPKPILSLPRMEEQEEEANTDTAELPLSELSVQPSDCAALLDATK